ncbi:MAG TPA: thrombospondin type 3 repeat-containing protein, partial [Phnomibacter sp.]|nr:thrombospondin type 3 repeat-containing protein [Phnomibacter sp.]
LQEQPHPVVALPAKTAIQAYTDVLVHAGASYRRDTLDQRIILDVKDRTGNIIDVQGGYPHGTPYERSKGAWPVLKGGTPPADSDGDGIPDAWEKKNGLDPNDPSDASKVSRHAWYTNIELYIHTIVQ